MYLQRQKFKCKAIHTHMIPPACTFMRKCSMCKSDDILSFTNMYVTLVLRIDPYLVCWLLIDTWLFFAIFFFAILPKINKRWIEEKRKHRYLLNHSISRTPRLGWSVTGGILHFREDFFRIFLCCFFTQPFWSLLLYLFLLASFVSFLLASFVSCLMVSSVSWAPHRHMYLPPVAPLLRHPAKDKDIYI